MERERGIIRRWEQREPRKVGPIYGDEAVFLVICMVAYLLFRCHCS